MHLSSLSVAALGAVLVLCPELAPAQTRPDIRWICLDRLEPEIRPWPPIRVPVGCEVIDCCPGCPGPPLDWRIQLEGPLVRELAFRFEGVAPDALVRLAIKGNGRWTPDGRLVLTPGETLVSGLPSSARGVPVASPELALHKDAFGEKDLHEKEGVGAPAEGVAADLRIDQRLRGYTVAASHFVLKWRKCWFWPHDEIDLDNNAGADQAVALVDGRRSGGCVDDEVLRTTDVAGVGSLLSPGACHNEAVVFSDGDAMQLVESPTWTDSLGDRVRVDLTPDLLPTPVTFWVMQGTFAATNGRVTNDLARANQLYDTMNCGIAFQSSAVNDATADTDTPGLINAACGDAANLRTRIGFTANQLNVYYLGNPGARGWWCGNNTIIVGAGADNESLAHELGHAFTLGHTNTVAGMSATNLMVTGGTGRNNVTEGQCFRCNANAGSTLNSNGVRTGPTRNCPDTTTTTSCPALSLDVIPN